MRKGILIFLAFVVTTAIAMAGLRSSVIHKILLSFDHSPGKKFHITNSTFPEKLSRKASDAAKYCKDHGFNQDFCFLVDMSLASGQNRFFVYNLKGDSILESGLVTHGRCNEEWLQGRKFDNRIGSGCTSLGKYRIGNSYRGRFGLAFKLYGLDKTNSNAFSRYVVLHSHECVPESETSEDICQSDGCPTVSSLFLQKLSRIIKGFHKPVLLWIYN
jgi:hypothetical protein